MIQVVMSLQFDQLNFNNFICFNSIPFWCIQIFQFVSISVVNQHSIHFPKYSLQHFSPFFYKFNFIISPIYHQELIFKLAFCARSHKFFSLLFLLCFSSVILMPPSLFSLFTVHAQDRRVHVTPSIIHTFLFYFFVFFFSRLFHFQIFRLSDESNIKHFVFLVMRMPFGVVRKFQLSIAIFAAARACILIFFFLLFFTFVFLNNYFSIFAMRCNICCQKFQRPDDV